MPPNIQLSEMLASKPYLASATIYIQLQDILISSPYWFLE